MTKSKMEKLDNGLRKLEHKRKIYLIYLKNCNGVIQHAADKMGISQSTVYSWMDSDPKFKEAVLDIRFKPVSSAEKLIFKKAVKNIKPAMFLLTHRHPDYQNRMKVEMNGNVRLEDLDDSGRTEEKEAGNP